MKRQIFALMLLGCTVFMTSCTHKLPATENTSVSRLPHVLVRTDAGDIILEIDSVHAPLTAWNFLHYVDQGYYDQGQFHRAVTLQNQPNNAVKIEVIQASADSSRKPYKPIPLERTNVTGLRHVDGAVSMARGAPDSATSDFFVVINDQPELDFGGRRNADGQGFAVFGRVVSGMDVVRKIQRSPVSGQKLTPPIRIIEARRVAS
jgi:peptidyl-prolyl cis-trans isomerase A (cyclophilin A)